VQVQKELLDGDTLLLEYALGDDNSYVWAVTLKSFASFTLPNRSEIEKRTRHFRELMTARAGIPGEKPSDVLARLKAVEAQYPEAAAELSRILRRASRRSIGNAASSDCSGRCIAAFAVRRIAAAAVVTEFIVYSVDN
jgi:poly-gamma-glutamate capsule biosynthesis protein CapA/YwtB (metallophosphatase superfamily)